MRVWNCSTRAAALPPFPAQFTAQLKACRSLYGGTQGAWSLAYFTRQQEYDDVADDCAGGESEGIGDAILRDDADRPGESARAERARLSATE